MGLFVRRDSPYFWISLQVNGQRVRLGTGVSDRSLAEDIFSAWKTEQARIRWLGGPPPDQDHNLQELIDAYLSTVTPKKLPDSQRRDRCVFKQFSERWGHLSLNDVTTKMIEDAMAERQKKISFATVSKEFGILKAAFNRAIHWNWTTRTPFKGIVLNQEGKERIRCLTYHEEYLLLNNTLPWLGDFIILGLDTGLRLSNLVGLKCGWIHRDGSLLIVPREGTKTKKGPVTIPLTRRAAEIITRRLKSSHGDYVLTQVDGHPYRSDQVSKAFSRAAKAAGLQDVCFYTFRHTFITRLVQAGRPLPEIATLAGHQNIRMTMRYVHLAPAHLKEAIKALETLQATQVEPIGKTE